MRKKRFFSGLGLDFEILDSGCCGMAGSFGFEKQHYDISMKIAERVLLPAINKTTPDTLLIINGFSCREQVIQATGREVLHLAQVLKMATIKLIFVPRPDSDDEVHPVTPNGLTSIDQKKVNLI